MNAFAAPYVGLPREAKLGHYQAQPLSSLSSPSATSSSSGDSEDLLPELWLETTPGPSQPPAGAATGGPHYTHTHMGIGPHPGAGPMSAPMFHDDSLAYAQSLLPHSLLFPLDGIDNARAPSEPSYKYSVSHETSPSPSIPHTSAHSTHAYSPTYSYASPLSSKSASHTNLHAPPAPPQPLGLPRRASSNSCSEKSRQDSVCSTGSCGSAKCQKSLNTQLYKTELCASFIKSGACPYGNKCQFAHGEHELKTVERPSNWRSKPCANWARHGTCRYGKRCCFKHGD